MSFGKPRSAASAWSGTAGPAAASWPAQSGLSESDRELMTALGAFHLRYGRTDEALALLQLVIRIWPQDRTALRLLTQSFLAIGDHASAEMTDRAYQLRQPIPTRADMLRRAAIWLGLGQINKAHSSLMSAISTLRAQQ
ncbi:tetratricopeptide repeat protein [Rhabdaerophilum sp. SD176]|uniref:tetratricopeptide repeat protein n=1 Tax=Rhabdaerophilum sp. SD176 TaxID=2983548 RepID=UPI0024DF7E66|nr:tetratricopeptide repeat protein [Rhabdaerophilum sp. SD176]